MSTIRARNPRADASARLGGGRTGLVLEPSPPTVDAGPWFADDPLTADVKGTTVSPIEDGEGGWDHAREADPDLATFARDHWLVGGSLPAPPSALAETRTALTALAFYVLASARQQANGKIGLRWTKGGFGTPFFADDRQVRVEGDHLVVQEGDNVRSAPITTLKAAGELVGITPGAPAGIDFHDAPPSLDPDEPLAVDAAAVAFLDQWFGFSTLVLERLRARAGSPDDTRVQLWAEHFDPAIELGDAETDSRASFGASPGDGGTPLPYLYVSPWTTQESDFWNAPFGGAMLTLDALRDAADPVAAALAFFEEGRRILG